MDNKPTQMINLDEVRSEIDAIDSQILSLLKDRFDSVAKVRLAKQQAGDGNLMPLRPGREAMIVRRLSDDNDSRAPDKTILRCWRSIICHSSLAQAHMHINVAAQLYDTPAARQAITDHFVDFPLKPYSKIKSALNPLAQSDLTLCAVPAGSGWLDHLSDSAFEGIGVIVRLVWHHEGQQQNILILGKAPQEQTGDDETLVATRGRLPRDFVPAPLWEVKTRDGYCLTSLPGYLEETQSPLIGLKTSNDKLALRVAGRYPSPFEG